MRFWREPLLHFALLGAALFAAFGSGVDRPAPDEIVIASAEVGRLAES